MNFDSKRNGQSPRNGVLASNGSKDGRSLEAHGRLRCVVTTSGVFHSFDLARELERRGWLERIFTAYPTWRLRARGLPTARVRSVSLYQTLRMGLARLGYDREALVRGLEWRTKLALDRTAARELPDCDVVFALSSSGLLTGRVAKARGAAYVCDRGSTHIRFQDNILREEHELVDLPYRPIDPRVIDREEAEYSEADLITVPSCFNHRSFITMGVPGGKVVRLPYGVDLSTFRPKGAKADRFTVLFVGQLSVRKGIHYLDRAFALAGLKEARLVFVGPVGEQARALLRRPDERRRLLGRLDWSGVRCEMARAHVMVLASVEEGLALVLGQALACGCPIIATPNTGAEDLIEDGREGFIVPIRDPEAIAERLVRLYRDSELLGAMSDSALARVRGLGGWATYGAEAATLFQRLANGWRPASAGA